ncbi:MAG: hypothetical protein JST00_15520 [Deltaproteobacteria bacterium]|nr:hypothetical protein [Deltaproteobacteria bacterium]
MSTSSASFVFGRLSLSPSFLRPLAGVAAAGLVASFGALGCSGKVEEPPPGGSQTSTSGASTSGATSSGAASSGASTSGASSSGGATSGGTSGAGTTTSPCENKACGVDCSPPGSDEPFACNVKGECVATGTPLACACPDFLADCRQGEGPADTDGDGCIDACRPVP